MNRIKIDIERTLGNIDRNIFGGFAEHLQRCIYGGIYEPDSPHADEHGLRQDVLGALRRLNMPLIRYPGGNFVSGYRWRDGVGKLEERTTRLDLAWHVLESNHFGTNEFITFCRKLNTEPYLAVNCGDGDMREARDWVEYCNGTQPTALVKLRQQHGFDAPHNVKYWGIGNEVDGVWQIGMKTAQEYARAYTEFGKLMKWVDPTIKLIAAGVSDWHGDYMERAQLLIEQAGELVDYLAMHWYLDNKNDFPAFMALSEQIEERISAYEGIIRAIRLNRGIKRDIFIAIDEWNTWSHTNPSANEETKHLGEIYKLEDALMIGIHFNAFIRHARTVKMANIAQIVNLLAPIITRTDAMFLQTIFFPFELYSRTCGQTTLDVFWSGDTFSGGDYSGVRVLDVAATLDEQQKQVVIYVVNRSEQASETKISITPAQTAGNIQTFTVNGAHIHVENSFSEPDNVKTVTGTFKANGDSFVYTFEPHSVTALVCPVA